MNNILVNQNINWKGEPGRLIRVAVGQNGVWGVNNAHEIYKKTPTSWEKIAGRLKDISVGKDTVWGVNRNDDIFMKMGGLDWKQISGKLMQVN